jgi:glycosyltransferase involved in cell wall biosynthesis
MKILHINWSGELGGAENIVYIIAKEQVKTGNDVTIAYMANKLVYGNRAKKEGIKVVEFNMCYGFDIGNFKRYIDYIKEERFDIIHDHNGSPLVRLSKLFCKTIFIQHIHGTKFGNVIWEKQSVLLWKRLTRRLVDHWVANSQHIKRIAAAKERIPLSKISVVYNGIDIAGFRASKSRNETRKELGLSEKDFVIGSVGCLDKAKGIDKMLLVAKEVDNKFVIIGDGELRKELESMRDSMGLKDKVIFTGSREDVPDLLSAFDIFLSTSQWEGFGIAIVEAMAVGVPVIVFAVDGVLEVMTQDCGILVPPNDIAKMKEAINYLKENKSIMNSMGKCGIKRVKENFDIVEKTKELQNLYKVLAG